MPRHGDQIMPEQKNGTFHNLENSQYYHDIGGSQNNFTREAPEKNLSVTTLSFESAIPNQPSSLTQTPTPKMNKFDFYFSASVLGALRGGVCLILEHPLDSIKTQWQDKTYFKSTREIVTHIYREKGIEGFYRGFLPNLVRVASKNFYRWPLMIFFPRFYEKNLPSSLKNYFPGIPKILTGLSIANIEIFIMTPLDRIKIFLMTTEINSQNKLKSGENIQIDSGKEKLENKILSKHTHTKEKPISTASKLLYFYQNHKQHIVRELFRGLEPTFWRSNVSWVSFLYLDHKVKRIFKHYLNKEKLSFTDLFFVSIFVGVGNLAAGKNKISNFIII
jgi:hypothetical protein